MIYYAVAHKPDLFVLLLNGLLPVLSVVLAEARAFRFEIGLFRAAAVVVVIWVRFGVGNGNKFLFEFLLFRIVQTRNDLKSAIFFEKMTIFEALKWNYRDQKCSINKSFSMPIHTYPLSKWAISFRECIPLSVNLHLNSKLTNKRLGSKIISRSSCYLSTELFSRRRYLPNCKQIWLLTFTHCLYCFVSS